RYHEKASITNLTGAGRRDDRPNRFVDDLIRDDDLDFHFGEQTDGVFLSPVNCRVALLVAVATNLADGHPGNIDAAEGCLDGIDLVWANDGFDQLHDERLLLPGVRRRPQVSRMSVETDDCSGIRRAKL